MVVKLFFPRSGKIVKLFKKFRKFSFRVSPKSGTTLIELMVVCALIVSLVTLVGVSARFLHRFAAYVEIEQLYMACRYMQRRAMCTHTEQTLHFNITNRSYTYAERSHTLSPYVMFGSMPNIKNSPSGHSVSKPITFVHDSITFYPSGIISAGTVYVTNKARSCCYALSNGVSHVSLLRRYRYHNGWKLI